MFWVFLISDILIPMTMVLAGFLLYKKCPKRVNHVVGYRTPMSMKNQDTWEFANTYCGKLWLVIGVIMTIITAVIHVLCRDLSEDNLGILVLIMTTVQIIMLLVTIAPVEHNLNKNFDILGNRI